MLNVIVEFVTTFGFVIVDVDGRSFYWFPFIFDVQDIAIAIRFFKGALEFKVMSREIFFFGSLLGALLAALLATLTALGALLTALGASFSAFGAFVRAALGALFSSLGALLAAFGAFLRASLGALLTGAFGFRTFAGAFSLGARIAGTGFIAIGNSVIETFSALAATLLGFALGDGLKNEAIRTSQFSAELIGIVAKIHAGVPFFATNGNEIDGDFCSTLTSGEGSGARADSEQEQCGFLFGDFHCSLLEIMLFGETSTVFPLKQTNYTKLKMKPLPNRTRSLYMGQENGLLGRKYPFRGRMEWLVLSRPFLFASYRKNESKQEKRPKASSFLSCLERLGSLGKFPTDEEDQNHDFVDE